MQKSAVIITTLLLACTSILAAENERQVARDILGLHLKMTKAEAEARLKKIGAFDRGERKGQEIWELRDKRFSHAIIGVDKNEDRLRFVTVVARTGEDAERMRYSEVGDPQEARQAGDPKINNFNYEWALPAEDGQPEMLVIARGRDPEFLSTYSLKRVGEDEEEKKEEKESNGGTEKKQPKDAKKGKEAKKAKGSKKE